MKIREWTIVDEAGKEIKFTVDSPPTNLIKVIKWEIAIELKTKRALSDLISAINLFMGGNTIHKVEVEEKVV